MIIEHVAVLVIDPCSPTALNGVIAKAVSAGIPVLDLNDGPVTATARHYELNCAQTPIMESEIVYEAKRLNGHGNILDIRGIAGTESDALYQVGLAKELKIYSGIKVVASVFGNWTDSVAESATAAVLPSLPTINGVVSQGGEEYGAVEAFEAAGRPVPIIWGGNRGNFLHWWVSEYKKNGYTTESESNNPGIGAAAMYVAVQIAAKKQVPHNMVMPNLLITQATLNKYLSVPVTGVAYKIYSASWFNSNLMNQGRNAASVYLDGPWPPASS
jgi:ribose transport system substrate-binding protein